MQAAAAAAAAHSTPTGSPQVAQRRSPSVTHQHQHNGIKEAKQNESTQAGPVPAPGVLTSTIPAQASQPEKPSGSCPGDGYCNGEGGKACCNGCPAFNNRYRASITASRQPTAPSIAVRSSSPAGLQVAESVAQATKPAAAISDTPQSPQSQHHPAARQTSITPQRQSNGTAAQAASQSARPQADDSDIGAMACENCGTRTTPLWRRDGEGRVACNACGLYYKLHGIHRPVNLNKPTIKRRKRIPAAVAANAAAAGGSGGNAQSQVSAS